MPRPLKVERPVADLASLTDWQRQIYFEPLELGRVLATQFLPQERQNIELVYLSAPSFNASASRRGEQYSIRIHIAVAGILHFVFNNLFQRPELLPKLGAFLQTDTYGVFDRGIPISLPVDVPEERATAQLVYMSKPSHDDRAALAAISTQIALSFCVLHEVAHVLNGHARYASLNFSEAVVAEFRSSRRRAPLEHDMRRAWEYEADKTAAAAVVQWLATDTNLREHIRQLMGRGVERNLLWLAGFSLRVVFRLLAQVQHQSGANVVHAPPHVRSEVVQIAIDYLYKSLPAKSREKLLVESYDNADALWQAMVPSSVVTFDDAIATAPLSALDDLENLLVQKRPAYAELAYVHSSPHIKPP